MPNITVYLTDDEYVKYLEKKEEINKELKETVQKRLAKWLMKKQRVI